METKIPLKGGDEYDALTKGGKRVHIWRAGDRKAIKQKYWQRFRSIFRTALRRGNEE